MVVMNTDTDFEDELPPSKSQEKRECEALKKMGDELLNLKQDELNGMNLPEELSEALLAAKKIQSRSGLKRQRQYIGKLMRHIDNKDIKEQIEKIKHKHDTNTAQFRKIEQWRDQLITGDKKALSEIIDTHPDVDRQHMNQLIRQARREHQQEKPPAASRKLFKYLRDLGE